MPRRRKEIRLSKSDASEVLSRFLQFACEPGGKLILRIEPDFPERALSIEVVAAQRFSVSGTGLEALDAVLQGTSQRVGAEVSRRRAIACERTLDNMLAAVEGITDGPR